MTRPVDVDGTPLHVGDLVRGTWYPDEVGYGSAGPWEITKCHDDGCITDSGATSHDDDGYYYTPESVRLVPETRQERIVRRSYERPQVVQVRYERGRLNVWALVWRGRSYPSGPRREQSLARARRLLSEHGVLAAAFDRLADPDDGTWTVL